MSGRRRDDNWVDGLRGLASFTVVTGHLCTAFIDYLHSPALEQGQQPLFFQLPIFRLCVGGRTAVAIFFLITGYVNAINPLRNFKNGAFETAFSNLSKSAFMRTWRLVLPTATAILTSWIIFEIGLYKMAKVTDSFWISFWIRNQEETVGKAVWRLLRAQIEFWMTGNPIYNATLWTVPFFLHGSMMVYVTILATAFVTPKSRKIVILGLFMMAWCGRLYLEHINIFFGLFMAELHTSFLRPNSSSPTILPSSPLVESELESGRRRFPRSMVRKLAYPLPCIAIILGMLAASYPEKNPDWAPWSQKMTEMLTGLIPGGTEISRYWASIGACLIFGGAYFSPAAQYILTSPIFNFLGRCSFPVYLIHDQVMRTVLVWLVYGGAEVKRNQEGKIEPLKRAGIVVFVLAIPVYYICTYLVAWLWMNHLDPRFARITLWLKNKCWIEGGETSPRTPAWSEKASTAV